MSGRPRPLVADGLLTPPRLDAEDYLDSVERCRSRYPELQILTGIEFGQSHLDEARARQVIDLDALDRVPSGDAGDRGHRSSA
ncbi:MAG TPA: hypothetical protein VLJ88_07995 [Propionibacteriaceae bacterium]|nr:hypothetical protein [Propionibacteriaceae bacterium]